MQAEKQQNPDDETLYDALIKKGLKKQAEKIPPKYREVITKGWYINLLNTPDTTLPEDLEPVVLEFIQFYKENLEGESITFPWPENEIFPHLKESRHHGDTAW